MEFDYKQRAYSVLELEHIANAIFLEDKGFIKVRERNLNGEIRYYFVVSDKFESPRHIICVKEIVDYLKEFTKEVETYRTTMPDIVFTYNRINYAIEVETGNNIRDKRKIANKIRLLNERFGKNWFFFVTNRNLERIYSKLGETSTKRNIKFKIRQIFKNSKKRANLPLRNQGSRERY